MQQLEKLTSITEITILATVVVVAEVKVGSSLPTQWQTCLEEVLALLKSLRNFKAKMKTGDSAARDPSGLSREQS
jgi:predicted nucleic acid-binding protein